MPVKPRQKKPPLIKAWQDKATTAAAMLSSWWGQWPDANIAVATGPGSGIVVIDIDGEPGELALQELQERLGPLPDTCEQTTGQGRQLFFEYPANASIRNTTALAGHKGIDVRGHGGYAIVPPSIHPNGNAYTWEASSDQLNGGVLAALPESWAAALNGSTPSTHPAGASERLREGERNRRLFELGCSMRNRGCGFETIEAALLSENDKRCVPQLDAKEVQKIASSAGAFAGVAGVAGRLPRSKARTSASRADVTVRPIASAQR